MFIFVRYDMVNYFNLYKSVVKLTFITNINCSKMLYCRFLIIFYDRMTYYNKIIDNTI